MDLTGIEAAAQRFRRTGRIDPACEAVRPEVVASWLRAVDAGVRLDAVEVSYVGHEPGRSAVPEADEVFAAFFSSPRAPAARSRWSTTTVSCACVTTAIRRSRRCSTACCSRRVSGTRRATSGRRPPPCCTTAATSRGSSAPSTCTRS
ncbi:hypothetical protein ACFQV8_26215 [Pseudonocardia benzenivorans]